MGQWLSPTEMTGTLRLSCAEAALSCLSFHGVSASTSLCQFVGPESGVSCERSPSVCNKKRYISHQSAGNEMSDTFAKEAAQDEDEQNTVYDRVPTTSVATELKKKGIIKWQRLWEGTAKGALCRSFFPTVGQRLKACCHGDSLRAGKSKWQVGYRVSFYCH
jgi:hypothetical protein